ncbi:hypothetical protein L9F63_007920, partial [Diploptera punctata]
ARDLCSDPSNIFVDRDSCAHLSLTRTNVVSFFSKLSQIGLSHEWKKKNITQI